VTRGATIAAVIVNDRHNAVRERFDMSSRLSTSEMCGTHSYSGARVPATTIDRLTLASGQDPTIVHQSACAERPNVWRMAKEGQWNADSTR